MDGIGVAVVVSRGDACEMGGEHGAGLELEGLGGFFLCEFVGGEGQGVAVAGGQGDEPVIDAAADEAWSFMVGAGLVFGIGEDDGKMRGEEAGAVTEHIAEI